MESDSFIFDDDVEEIGSDVEAYCPKCKADTAHVIVTKYEDEIRRVQCSPCSDVHAFRKPRGDTEEEAQELEKPKKTKVIKKPTWDEFFAKNDADSARPYSFRETYTEGDLVTHPKFGIGYVSEIMGEDKVEITFKDSRRVLVHSRKELPGAPPELARPPKPKVVKGKKGAAVKAKGKAAAKQMAKAMPVAKAKQATKAKAIEKPTRPIKNIKKAAKKSARPIAKPKAKAAARKATSSKAKAKSARPKKRR